MRKAALFLIFLGPIIRADPAQNLYLIHQLALALHEDRQNGDRSFQAYFDLIRTSSRCMARTGALCTQVGKPDRPAPLARRMQLLIMDGARLAETLEANKKPLPPGRFQPQSDVSAAQQHANDRQVLRELYQRKSQATFSAATLHYLYVRSLCEIYAKSERLAFLNEFAGSTEGRRILNDLPAALRP